MDARKLALSFLFVSVSAVHAQQPTPWTAETDQATGNVTVTNTSTGKMTPVVISFPNQGSAPATVYSETCGGTPWTRAPLEPGSALCIQAKADPIVYIVRGSPSDPQTAVYATRLTVVQPKKSPAPLAFVRDTNDALTTTPTATSCNPNTSIRLTNTTVPNQQVVVCRTAEGVLHSFYPVDSGGSAGEESSGSTPTRSGAGSTTTAPESPPPGGTVQGSLSQASATTLSGSGTGAAGTSASSTESSEPQLPERAVGEPSPGIYTVPGNETLKDLKLTIRVPFYWPLLLIMAGVLFSTLVGLLLSRWSAVQQLRASLKVQGLNPNNVPPLTIGQYKLNTTEKELKAYLTWWKFWLPTEHAERLAHALLSWRDVKKELGRLDAQMTKINNRATDFHDNQGNFYFVIQMLQRVQHGGANQSKYDPLLAAGAFHSVDIQDATDVRETIREAALLAEHLTTYKLPSETGTREELSTARAALLRELDDETDWQGLTAAEFQKYHAGLATLRSTMLNALVLEEQGAATAAFTTLVREQMTEGRTLDARPYPLSVHWPELPAVLTDNSQHKRRATRRTTLTRIAPLLLWNWLGVLVGALVAWLLGSVTGLQTLYFNGEPWGSVPMDYARAFVYGAVTLAALASVVTFAKTLLPTAWQTAALPKPPAAAIGGKEEGD